MNHMEVSQRAVEILRQFPEVQKLVLFGSVNKGDYRRDSDIDLAVICYDEWKSAMLDNEGYPQGLREEIDYSLCGLRQSSGIRLHVPIYWHQEFSEGIHLESGKKEGSDLLHEVGSVVYDSEIEKDQ